MNGNVTLETDVKTVNHGDWHIILRNAPNGAALQTEERHARELEDLESEICKVAQFGRI